MSGFSASIAAASATSLASTDSATFLARPLTRSPSMRAASSPRFRGDGGKNTKPTMSAPASSAASRASGVFNPQILTRSAMVAGVLARLWSTFQPLAAGWKGLAGQASHSGDFWRHAEDVAPEPPVFLVREAPHPALAETREGRAEALPLPPAEAARAEPPLLLEDDDATIEFCVQGLPLLLGDVSVHLGLGGGCLWLERFRPVLSHLVLSRLNCTHAPGSARHMPADVSPSCPLPRLSPGLVVASLREAERLPAQATWGTS